jgi:DNA-directed RNA polymerase subunit L
MFRNYQFDSKDPSQCHSFEVHGVDVSIVNGIRRSILTDIEVVGFSGEENPSLEIVTNTGRLHNEIIMHRFGLLPIHVEETETDAYPANPLYFELHKKNEGDDTVNVTTHDFKIVKRNDIALTDAEIYRLFPVDMVSKQPILITRLRPKEELHVRGEAVKKTARFHAGFSPVSLCTFHNMQDPVLAATQESVLDKERAFLRNEFGDPIAFHFDIEPKLKLSPRYLVSKAIDILIAKVGMVLQEIYQEHSDKVEIKVGDTGGVNFTFLGEDDTLGNLLQSYLHVNFVRPKKQGANGHVISYVGYYCPHPLDNTMVLNLRFDDETEKKPIKDYIDTLALAARNLSAHLQDLLNAWLRFAPKS